MAKGLKEIHTITNVCIKNKKISGVGNEIGLRLQDFLIREIVDKDGMLDIENPPECEFQVTFQRTK